MLLGYVLKEAADAEPRRLCVRPPRAARISIRVWAHGSLASGESSGPSSELSERAEIEVLRLISLGTRTARSPEAVPSVRTVELHRAHIQQSRALDQERAGQVRARAQAAVEA